ncbi:YidC/Oxa1 family membrane protein insertase [Rubritalea squalenifaciens DSM 18772]|uniref:Membrane protein insertase YidC n=1 Tax=Rubritalea squalenifaciens DSM 18772 TaxID=1123071 RepID=A0A1M6MGY7_9BACT|nr:membrane protein insertase YidC [Rubritalea squalenifaciens]SHJ82751.1 YidC/Oxa1 family membrane protein insertase [Rubritalea squalenifaciens DSM 18772]
MDRKAWIILIVCGLGLMLNYQFMMKNQEDLDRQKQQEEQQSEAPAGTEKAPELITEKPEIERETREDVPFQLIGKDGEKVDVIYNFTSFGGGVNDAEFPNQKEVNGDGHVRLNLRSSYAVGALADDFKKIDKTYYQIVSGGKEGDDHVTYRATLENGLQVTKEWTLKDGADTKGYQLHLAVTFKNTGDSSVNLNDWGVYTGTAAPLHTDELQDKAGWFYYADGSFEFDKQGPFTKGWFSSAKPVELVKTTNLEYAGVNSQFFTTFFMPKGFSSDSIWATGREIDLGDNDDQKKRWMFEMGVDFPDKSLGKDEQQSYAFDIYMGPKERDIIKTVGPNTDPIMNYGWFWFVANFMNWAVNHIHNWFEGYSWAWGAAIILLTLFIRILIWPLHNKSTRTMKRMGKLQPLMKELKEKYADNPQKMNQETMKLYREYGVNPMGGCLPMLLQIPIFFGVFKMLGSAVEMRGASFLWVDDLSLPDTVYEIWGLPINMLPIVMAVTMIFQMRLTPQTGDKLQRRIFMLMPLMFFFFCYNYASALALYWSTQNIISIGQTLLMQRLPEPELSKKKPGQKGGGDDDGKPRKKGFFERLAEKMEEVQAQQEAARGAAKPTAQAPADKKPKKRSPRTGG